jgi:hypothetical protein
MASVGVDPAAAGKNASAATIATAPAVFTPSIVPDRAARS